MSTRTKKDSGPEGKPPPRPRSASKRGASKPDDGLAAALTAGMTEVVPGFETVDRELEFQAGGRADLVGLAAGRLVFVLVAGDDEDVTLVDVLDTVAFGERHRAVVAQHVGRDRVRLDLEPKTIVVATGGADSLTQRLTPLLGRWVEVYTLETLRSEAGERAYLVPVVPPPSNGPGGSPDSAAGEAFVASLPGPLRSPARALVERMARLDDQLEVLADGSSMEWRYRGDSLARLERHGDRLEALFGTDSPASVIGGDADADTFVESALGRLVNALGVAGAPPPAPAVEAAFGDGPILTPEEIDAFRD